MLILSIANVDAHNGFRFEQLQMNKMVFFPMSTGAILFCKSYWPTLYVVKKLTVGMCCSTFQVIEHSKTTRLPWILSGFSGIGLHIEVR